MLFNNDISLVIFTSEGREHLLQETFKSFTNACNYSFSNIILAIDGQISQTVIDEIRPDVIVQSLQRKGFVNNIVLALRQVDTKYFFWLEDDFVFHREVPINYMLKIMMQNTSWAAIFLSRTAPLTADDKQEYVFDQLYVPHFGYSTSPTLCNTLHMTSASDAMVNYPKDDTSVLYGVEPFFNNYFKENNLKTVMIDPGDTPQVSHVGQLESTAREFHMINSIDKEKSLINTQYISGFGFHKKISLKNKIGVFFKLWLASASLSIKLWSAREAYDFAFRIYLASLKKFKH